MDRDILRQFYRRYSREIYLYLYSLCKSRETAEDLMQEVFLKALLSLPDQNENLRAWLYKVARNACFNELRNRKREVEMDPARGLMSMQQKQWKKTRTVCQTY